MLKTFIKKATLTAALTVAALGSAFAEYPEKPITMVIPFGAGGSHDLNARVITSILPTYLNTPVIVRLTPGAGGQKGTQEVANAPADGYTLLFTHNYVDMLQQYVENVPYNPIEDFVPIARVNFAPTAVVVRADSPYETFEDLISAAAEKEGSIRMSHSGNWGAFFVAAAQIMQVRDVVFNLVPYQGGGPALQALLSGDADVTMGFPSTLSAQLDAGEIRLLATAGEQRMFDDVPTYSEVGIEGDVGFMHRVLLAPKGTPDEAIAKLSDAFQHLVEDKTFIGMMGRLNESIDLIDGPGYQTLREGQAVAYKELVDLLTGQ